MNLRQIALSAGLLALLASAQGEPFRNKSLSPQERAKDLVQRLTLDEKISQMMDYSPAIERLGIPEYNWWNEALHGVGRAGLATVFPQCIGMAATFDDAAVGRAFDVVSTEARAKYNRFRSQGSHGRYQGLSFWTPNVNIFRDPRWGRGQETYGEDPYLTSRMGAAVVRGLQGPDSAKYIKSLAGAKHYAVHSGPEWNRHSYDAKNIDPRDLWETYLPSFKALVDAGVGQVMCAYNRYEGEPCCSNNRLLQQILRTQWGYDRIIVTDCWAIGDLFTEGRHNTHKSAAHASADAVISGTDLECGQAFFSLREAYDKGLISEDAIDKAVTKLFTERFRLGEIDDDPDSEWASIPYDVVDCNEHRAVALDLARKSMTLLKNNGILPLPKSGKKILVMGPNAADSVMQWGNYNGFPSHTVTVVEGIRALAEDTVPYLRACDYVINRNAVSHFGDFSNGGKKGMKASYWNGKKQSGKPNVTGQIEVPANFSAHGATVFAPGVNLEGFSAKYEGEFIASETGEYVFSIESSAGKHKVTVDGVTVLEDESEWGTPLDEYKFHADKGDKHTFSVEYSNPERTAVLKFDLGRLLDYETNPGDADIVVFVGGISPLLEGEEMPIKTPGFRGGDRETIELPDLQRNMLKELKAQGKQVVFVNCSGSAVALAPEDELCDAILQAWYPGQAGGQAVAEVLFGDYNPAGRLPVTFYKDDSQLPDFEDYSMEGRTYRFMTEKPLYPFGYGLSYTTFAYELDSVEKTDEGYALSVNVKNTGDREGDEVAQVYVESVEKGLMPKSLRGFKRCSIKPGETVQMTFILPDSSFETYNYATEKLEVVPAQYNLWYGGSSDALQSVKIEIE